MKPNSSTLSPPTRLAIAYARVDLRAAWAMLLAFDDRLAGVVGRSSEPIFAQMKIAWWQDVFAKPAALRPPGEPLLAELQRLDDAGQTAGVIPAMQLLLDAWGMLAAQEDWASGTLHEFAEARSSAVFGTYANWIASGDCVPELGQRWAVDDLAARFDKVLGDRQAARPCRMSRRLRPLSILALSVRPDVSGARVVWHALTGR